MDILIIRIYKQSLSLHSLHLDDLAGGTEPFPILLFTEKNLLKLPREVLGPIANLLTADDIFNFALTCRRAYDNSIQALRKRRSRERFRRVTIEIPKGKNDILREWHAHPFWLLRAILEEPDIADYVHTLGLRTSFSSMPLYPLADLADAPPGPVTASASHPTLRTKQGLYLRNFLRQHLRQIKPLLGSLSWDGPGLRGHLDRKIPRRQWLAALLTNVPPGAIALLILLQLHRLQKLELRTELEWETTILLMNGICDPNGWISGTGSGAVRPLTHLTEVELDSPLVIEECFPLTLIWGFLKLPTLRVFRGLDLYIRTIEGLPGFSSQVENLMLMDCDPMLCGWITNVAFMGRLKIFCSTAVIFRPGDKWWCPPRVLEWLWRSSGPTLEKLVLYHSYTSLETWSNHYMGSLCMFPKLKVAKVMSTAFMPWDVVKDCPVGGVQTLLVDALPPTLEKLVLVGDGPVDKLEEMFLEMYWRKRVRLPRLRKIIFEEQVEIDMDLLLGLGEVGLKVIVGAGRQYV
ncbi:MAG: hypothetical protein Q9219_003305 [cf. Caloplaca sp. 3 TL-2023]